MKKRAKTQTENQFPNTTSVSPKFKKKTSKKCDPNHPKINLYQIIFNIAHLVTFSKRVMALKITGYFTIKKKNKINMVNFK